jgi:hypothetical protein
MAKIQKIRGYALISVVTEAYICTLRWCVHAYYTSLSISNDGDKRPTTRKNDDMYSKPTLLHRMYIMPRSSKLTCSHACIRPIERETPVINQYKYNTSCPPSPSRTPPGGGGGARGGGAPHGGRGRAVEPATSRGGS